MHKKNNLLDNEVYAKATMEYQPEMLPSNHADDCTTEAFNDALKFITEIAAEKLKGTKFIIAESQSDTFKGNRACLSPDSLMNTKRVEGDFIYLKRGDIYGN